MLAHKAGPYDSVVAFSLDSYLGCNTLSQTVA